MKSSSSLKCCYFVDFVAEIYQYKNERHCVVWVLKALSYCYRYSKHSLSLALFISADKLCKYCKMPLSLSLYLYFFVLNIHFQASHLEMLLPSARFCSAVLRAQFGLAQFIRIYICVVCIFQVLSLLSMPLISFSLHWCFSFLLQCTVLYLTPKQIHRKSIIQLLEFIYSRVVCLARVLSIY